MKNEVKLSISPRQHEKARKHDGVVRKVDKVRKEVSLNDQVILL